jgi:hypothetical protein
MDCSTASKSRPAATLNFPAVAAKDNAPADAIKFLRSMSSPFVRQVGHGGEFYCDPPRRVELLRWQIQLTRAS